ncbi:hypothetical protein SSCG_05919 [Streptomyces clavuligerus]|nr:hypothetical protein SSCG_05919 [Streptomyces clavuligerus]
MDATAEAGVESRAVDVLAGNEVPGHGELLGGDGQASALPRVEGKSEVVAGSPSRPPRMLSGQKSAGRLCPSAPGG